MNRFYILLAVLFSTTICRAQTPATNSAPHHLPKMADIKKWRTAFPTATQQAAEQGDTDAMLALYFDYAERGRYSQHNPGEECDDCRQARIWLTKAAQAGNAWAQAMLGIGTEEPSSQDSYTPRPNMPEAVHWYRLSADQGWPGGEYRLALCYLHGKGIEQDEARAVDLLRKAVDQDHTYSLVALADCYARGIGTPRNENERPLELLKRAAVATMTEDNASKIAEAYDHIIYRYKYGVGTQRDIITAARWYCHAALHGINRYTLADKVEINTPKNPPAGGYSIATDQPYIIAMPPNGWPDNDALYAALSLYLHAARGDANAMLRIGESYLADDSNNPAQAYRWLTLASQHGAKNADEKLSKAQSALSKTELADMQKKVPDLAQELERVAAAIH